jgi:hypothetical protein
MIYHGDQTTQEKYLQGIEPFGIKKQLQVATGILWGV